jgi:hypothetical protein
MDAPVEIARILLPRSSVNARLLDYPLCGRLLREGDEILAETLEDPPNIALSTYFGLDLKFHRTVPVVGFEAEYNRMAAQRQVRGSFHEEMNALQRVEEITAANW